MSLNPGLDPIVSAVTERIIERSRPYRTAYLQHLTAAKQAGVQRSTLSCTNLAHGFAAFPANDKLVLKQQRQPSVAIVSSYNDMLSAHQPFERFPAIIKDAVRSEEHTSELQSLMRISYAVFCLKKKTNNSHAYT